MIPDQMRSFLRAGVAVAALALTVLIWRRREASLALRYSSLLFATVLIAPHLTVYDLVVLAPAFLLLADWLTAHASYRINEMFTVSLEGQNLLDDEQTYSINGNRLLSQGYYRYGRSFNLGVSVKF